MRVVLASAAVATLSAILGGCVIESSGPCNTFTDFHITSFTITPSEPMPAGGLGPYLVEYETDVPGLGLGGFRLYRERGEPVHPVAWYEQAGLPIVSPAFTWWSDCVDLTGDEGFVHRLSCPSPVDAGAPPGRYIVQMEVGFSMGLPSCLRSRFLEVEVTAP